MDKFLFKKFLGQVFLVDQNIQRKIINACDFKPQDYVLEIGAGNGKLTELILEKGAKVFALEVDYHLYEELKKKFFKRENIKILKKSILDFNIKKYFKDISEIKVFGNIPYYITSPIISHLIKHRDKINEAYLTVQKEFAQRIISLPGSKLYGMIACYVQYYTDPEILFYIKKRSFYPVPKVDSCFIKLKFKRGLTLDPKEENELFRIIHFAFNKRRKMLKNNLKGIVAQEKLEKFFKRFNISAQTRAEELSIYDFINLLKTD